MSHPIYLVDAFADRAFSGNPAGVVVLDEAGDPAWMQNVAMEMNQAETAFVWPQGHNWRLAWYTPTTEVDLCGHATLASAEVLFQRFNAGSLVFETLSGPIECARKGEEWSMNFPAEAGAEHAERGDKWNLICQILGQEPMWFGRNRMDWLALVEEEQVRSFQADPVLISKLGMRGLILTAQDKRGQDYDFISRFFAPQSGVPEDPVTGSAHCFLGPFWSERLLKTSLYGFQASKRGGYVRVDIAAGRCQLAGKATIVLEGVFKA